jgi:hypothetical protein
LELKTCQIITLSRSIGESYEIEQAREYEDLLAEFVYADFDNLLSFLKVVKVTLEMNEYF